MYLLEQRTQRLVAVQFADEARWLPVRGRIRAVQLPVIGQDVALIQVTDEEGEFVPAKDDGLWTQAHVV